MKRPKKNKISNPTLPDDQQPDERNLIDTEESEDISLEDRIHLYWMENKGFISGCIIVLALLIIGFNGMKIYVSYAEDKIQSAYADAKANDTLEDFAKAHNNKTLGGLAALEVADTAYTAGEYATAGEFYSIAVNALDTDILLGRASIGQAFATFYDGDEDKGLAQLRALAADSGLPEAIRAEAAYHLAVDADVSGDSGAFESYASQVSSSSTAGQWQQRMQIYQQQR
jgi:predicted negative regulator of RcsB-dependent stress response